MTVKQLTEQHLESLTLKGGCTGSSESTLVKMPHCWKSHVMAKFGFEGLTHYLIETPFNTFSNRAGPDQAALIRAA